MWLGRFRKYEQTEVRPMKESKSNDVYRVGVTADGNTTLTLSGENGFSMTLTMNAASVRQMIRLLESTLPLEDTSDE